MITQLKLIFNVKLMLISITVFMIPNMFKNLYYINFCYIALLDFAVFIKIKKVFYFKYSEYNAVVNK